jgi:y4mF family transcriptional regulator
MKQDFYIQLVEVIKQHREISGLNRNKLAQLAGVGKTAVYDVEHGKQTVRLDTVVKILEVLNIKLEFNSKLIADKKIKI